MTGWGCRLKRDFLLICRAAQLVFLVVHRLLHCTGKILYNLMTDEFEELSGLKRKNNKKKKSYLDGKEAFFSDELVATRWFTGELVVAMDKD